MKEKIIIFLGLLLCVFCIGCGEVEKEENKMNVYYLNADGNALLQATYPQMDIEGILEKIKSHSVLPKGVEIEHYKLDKLQLSLYFNEKYNEMSKNNEVLIRAAIVQTMTQHSEVEFVSFFIENEPLRNNDGNIVGLMNAQDFVQNTGSSMVSYQTTDLNLFFATKDGKHLKEVKKTDVRYNVNTAIEKLVVERLMKENSTSNSQSVIPSTTKLLGVSVKDGICYVNFDSKFSTDSYDLDPEVTIYAIVNSIIKNANVLKVQILIDGVSDVVYKNKVDLSRPLEWNDNLIEE